MQLTLRRQQLRSVAHAWSAFINGLVLQQCQLSDIYIFIFHTKFRKDIQDLRPRMPISGFLVPVISSLAC